MTRVMPLAIALGVAWNLLAVHLMGGRFKDALSPGWLAGGALAGVVAGVLTMRSRRRTNGRERWIDVLATYYLAIIVYWAGIVLVERAVLCIRHGGWTDFNLGDHLRLIGVFLAYGTFPYGMLLIPLCFASRELLWRAHRDRAD
jgi:hypothetical protein